tara:strand:+ start:1853 stop:2056 length:204 start_codon:yes stop_codon:yes gene_type:complete
MSIRISYIYSSSAEQLLDSIFSDIPATKTAIDVGKLTRQREISMHSKRKSRKKILQVRGKSGFNEKR